MDKDSELRKISNFLTIDDKTKEKLLKINDLKFLKLLTPLILLSYLDKRLTQSDDSIILITFYISTIEAIQNVKSRNKNISKKKLVCSFLRDNLTSQDKIKLLRDFIFSRKYKFRNGSGKTYHLMRYGYKKSITNPYEIPELFCHTGDRPECQCVGWLRDNERKINLYLRRLSFHFYQMRCAVFHDGSGVLWVHDFENSEQSSGSLHDAYSVSDGSSFVNYGSGMNKKDFYIIMKSAFENFLSNL